MNIAFIPVRGGSKSIPLKNIKPLCGKPLVYWTVKAACDCKSIDRVYVSTDSEAIRRTVDGFGFSKVTVISRSARTACDTASTESAMLEFAENYQFDTIALIQATSPLLTSKDLNGGFSLYESENTDSVLSVVRQKRFNWKLNSDNSASPSNYDPFNRPRRQEFDGYLVENGAFYITSRKILIEKKNRIGGIIRAYEMPEDTFFEIDEPSDWTIIEMMMKRRLASEIEMPEIKLFLTDCDGCLTDAGMYYSEHGDEMKKFNTKDGAGFGLLRQKGILTGIITGEDVELNRRRAEKLHLDVIESGIKDKAPVLKKICEKFGVSPENTLYVGDDLPDIGAMEAAGFSACPADAVEEVRAAADYVAKSKGGEGVIRELADMVLKS